MANIVNLALRIYGGPLECLEKQPYVSLGSIPDKFTPALPTIVDEQQAWIITHAQDYTLFATSSRRCNTVDGNPGQVLICLFFPPQKRLADGHSPLELLDSVMDHFVVQALRGGKLPNVPIDNSQFQNLMGKYRLEERPVSLPVMQGNEPVAFCAENRAQLDAIMRHSRYPVLSSVGRLELGFSCKSNIVLMRKSAIPRPKVVAKSESIRPRQGNQNLLKSNSKSSGLSLDDGPVVKNPFPNKKVLKVVTIFIGVIFGLSILIGIIGAVNKNDDSLTESIAIVDEPNKLEEPESIYMNDTAVVDSIVYVDIEETENERVAAEAKAEAEKEKAKAKADAEAKAERQAEAKAEAEKAQAEAKARSEAKRQSNEENWQLNIKRYARSCPIQIRLGVHLTSVTYTINSVTYTANYKELSKYNLNSDEKKQLSEDRSEILRRFGNGLPSNVSIRIIQVDKAGRQL